MKTNPQPTLEQYLAPRQDLRKISSPSDYVVQGAACVTPEDRARLQHMLPAVRSKARQVRDSEILRARVEVLAKFVEESAAGPGTPAQREATFVLYYFLKGYDLLPDSLPEIGLLDDAQLVETVLRRNEHELRGHWSARGRAWPS